MEEISSLNIGSLRAIVISMLTTEYVSAEPGRKARLRAFKDNICETKKKTYHSTMATLCGIMIGCVKL